MHLSGDITINLFAPNPETQRSKWVAIDADFEGAMLSLLQIQMALRQDGIEAALERSRRGGHLWIFCDAPLLASECRVYIYNLALHLGIPVKCGSLKEAEPTPEGQLAFLKGLRKLPENKLKALIHGMSFPETYKRVVAVPYIPISSPAGMRQFHILHHVRTSCRDSRNWWARCPSCALVGRDRTGDNLSIQVKDPRFYKCWAGCSKEEIRAALGQPIGMRFAA